MNMFKPESYCCHDMTLYAKNILRDTLIRCNYSLNRRALVYADRTGIDDST